MSEENDNIIQAPSVQMKLADLKPWEQNPRRINKEGLDRLEAKIKRLGLYKPLIVTTDNVIVGGNMRYQVLKRMGITDVWCTIVNPASKAQMIEIAISDNENDGEWVPEQLTELIHDQPIDLELYTVHLANMPLQTLVEGPPHDDDKQKVEFEADKNRELECPECGHRNTPSAFKPMVE